MSEKSTSDLPPFAEGIVGFDAERRPHLLGSHCQRCGKWAFPPAGRCRHCQENVEPCSLGSTGTLYSVTTVRIRPPLGFPQPYRVAYVDLDDAPLRVFMPLDPAAPAVAIGAAVTLVVGPLGVNNTGAPCTRPYFSPHGG
jgi:uncharacterized protein